MNFKPRPSKDVLAKQPFEPIPSLKGGIKTEGAVEVGRPKKKASPKAKSKAKKTGGFKVTY